MKTKIISSKKTLIAVIAIILVCTAVLSTSTVGYYAFSKSQKKLPIYSVERSDKKISISFDCAWGAEYTEKILDALDEYGVKATFFMVEFWTTKYPETVKKIDEKGHEIGTHSKSHGYMSKFTESKIKEELESSSRAITAITGKEVELFRAPYGDYNNRLIETANGMNYHVIQWDVDSLDWKDLSAKEITFRVINKVKSGSIILCHNNGLHTAESLPMIFEFLQNKGYEFVPIGELIYESDYTIDSNGRQKSNK